MFRKMKWPNLISRRPSTASLKKAVAAVGMIAAASSGPADATTIGMNASGYGDMFNTFQGCFYVVAGVLVVCYLAYIAYLAKRRDPATDQREHYEKMKVTPTEYRLLIGREHPGDSVFIAHESVPENMNHLQK